MRCSVSLDIQKRLRPKIGWKCRRWQRRREALSANPGPCHLVVVQLELETSMAHESFAKMRQGNDASSKVGRALYVNQSANAGRSSTRTPSAADCLRAPFFVVRLRAIATRRKAPAFPKDRHSPGVARQLGCLSREPKPSRS